MAENNTKYIIIAVTIIALAAIAAFALMMTGTLDLSSNPTITVNSEDTSMSGKLTITEFINIEKNSNGTYNVSQFMNNYGAWTGNTKDIPIKDGKAEYELSEDTQFFTVNYYIMDIRPDYGFGNDTAPIVEVKYIANGDEVLSSSNQAYVDQCDITWGGRIYDTDGNILNFNDFNIDIPALQDYFDTLSM